MNFRSKYIIIPEIEFSDLGDIISTSSNSIHITIDVHDYLNIDKFVDGLLEQSNKLDELLIYEMDWKNIDVYTDLSLTSLDINLNEPPIRCSNYEIPNYELNIVFEFEKYYKTIAKTFERRKKLNGIITNIKNG